MTRRLRSGRTRIGQCVVEWSDETGITGAVDCLASLAPVGDGLPVTLRWTVRAFEPTSADHTTTATEVLGRFGSLQARATAHGLRLDGAHAHAVIQTERVDVVLEAGAEREARVIESVALALALRPHGLYHLHAGAVALDGRAFVVAGDSGAGKTTTTLALMTSRCAEWLSDDTVFLAPNVTGEPAVAIVGLARTFHVAERTLGAFPSLSGLAAGIVPEGASMKRRLDPHIAFPERHRPSATPAVLVFPRIVDRATMARRIQPRDAFARLVEPGALALLDGPGGTRPHVAALGALVGLCQCLDLDLGPDALERPPRVCAAIDAALEPFG